MSSQLNTTEELQVLESGSNARRGNRNKRKRVFFDEADSSKQQHRKESNVSKNKSSLSGQYHEALTGSSNLEDQGNWEENLFRKAPKEVSGTFSSGLTSRPAIGAANLQSYTEVSGASTAGFKNKQKRGKARQKEQAPQSRETGGEELHDSEAVTDVHGVASANAEEPYCADEKVQSDGEERQFHGSGKHSNNEGILNVCRRDELGMLPNTLEKARYAAPAITGAFRGDTRRASDFVSAAYDAMPAGNVDQGENQDILNSQERDGHRLPPGNVAENVTRGEIVFEREATGAEETGLGNQPVADDVTKSGAPVASDVEDVGVGDVGGDTTVAGDDAHEHHEHLQGEVADAANESYTQQDLLHADVRYDDAKDVENGYVEDNEVDDDVDDDDIIEERVEYVVLDLGQAAALRRQLVEGSFRLSNLDTATPMLELSNGIKLVGEYEETVGTTLLLEETGNKGDYGMEKGAEMERGEGGAQPKGEQKTELKLFGKTNLMLKFRPVDMPTIGKKYGA